METPGGLWTKQNYGFLIEVNSFNKSQFYTFAAIEKVKIFDGDAWYFVWITYDFSVKIARIEVHSLNKYSFDSQGVLKHRKP